MPKAKTIELERQRREKISNSLKGRTHTLEHRQAVSSARMGKFRNPLSEEHKQHVSEALLARSEHLSMVHKGKKPSEETKEKMSLSQQGRKMSESAKQAISVAVTESWKDPESRNRHVVGVVKSLLNWEYVTGSAFSPKIGEKIYWRSSYEKTALDILERCPLVKSFVLEPFAIHYIDFAGNARGYVPDYFVNLTDGRKFLVEVKPRDRREVLKEFVAQIFCEKIGVFFTLWTEDVLFPRQSATELEECETLFPPEGSETNRRGPSQTSNANTSALDPNSIFVLTEGSRYSPTLQGNLERLNKESI